jgi:hypothetical protein
MDFFLWSEETSPFMALVKDCVCRWQHFRSNDALKEDHRRRTFNFFLMGTI